MAFDEFGSGEAGGGSEGGSGEGRRGFGRFWERVLGRSRVRSTPRAAAPARGPKAGRVGWTLCVCEERLGLWLAVDVAGLVGT